MRKSLLMAVLFLLPSISLAGPGNIPVTRWVSPDGSRPMTFEEWQDSNPSASFRIGEVGRTGERDSLIEVVVNSSLFDSLISYLSPDSGQYIQDLTNQGYTVRVDTATFSNTLADAESLRSLFQSLLPQGLVGAVLIGDLPVPWYQMLDNFGDTSRPYEEFPIDLFYMDLDGVWEDTLMHEPIGDSLIPGCDSILDSHHGNMAADIWVGRLSPSPLGGEVPILRNYFQKDHAYRADSLPLLERALVYVDDDWILWAGQWSSNVGLVYPVRTTVSHPETTIANDYRGRLSHNYEWVSVFAHSSPAVHGFKYNNGNSWSWFYAYEIPGIDPQGSFYNLFACSNARYVEAGYMGGRYIFTDTYGLGAVGSAKTGSMLEFQDFYSPLSHGKCLGDGFREWFATWAEAWADTSRSWFYGMTLLGDPTLSPIGTTPGVEEVANVEFPVSNSRLLEIHPNPFSGFTTIRYRIPETGDRTQDARHIALSIYDLAGRLVKTLLGGSQAVTGYESPVAVGWDGKDSSGRPVASGVYLCKLSVSMRSGKAGKFESTAKMVVLR